MKMAHKVKLEKAFKGNNAKQIWDTMKGMTGLSTTQKSLELDNEMEFVNQLDKFLQA